MSQENVELVSRLYADFGLSPRLVEAAAQAGLIAPDAEFDYSALLPDGPVVRGVKAWGEHADSSPWGGSLKLVSERIFDVDDERVLVLVHSRAEGEGSGAAVEGRTATEFTIRDGAIVRIKLYKDRTEALKAAGLSE
jgi:ketosteroid isomerase-like protein